MNKEEPINAGVRPISQSIAIGLRVLFVNMFWIVLCPTGARVKGPLHGRVGRLWVAGKYLWQSGENLVLALMTLAEVLILIMTAITSPVWFPLWVIKAKRDQKKMVEEALKDEDLSDV